MALMIAGRLSTSLYVGITMRARSSAMPVHSSRAQAAVAIASAELTLCEGVATFAPVVEILKVRYRTTDEFRAEFAKDSGFAALFCPTTTPLTVGEEVIVE